MSITREKWGNQQVPLFEIKTYFSSLNGHVICHTTTTLSLQNAMRRELIPKLHRLVSDGPRVSNASQVRRPVYPH